LRRGRVLMSGADEWGKDPAVRAMRKVFREMEDAQGEFFSRMGIGDYDPRIRPWREKGLVLFERAFSYANRAGVLPNEKAASEIYLHCLARIMRSEGVSIHKEFLPGVIDIEEIFKEAL
jgi:hypothetical protein